MAKYVQHGRVVALDEAVTHSEFPVAYANLLPTVQFSAGNANRSNTPGFSSATPSDQYGPDRSHNTTNLAATHSILDFGLSYTLDPHKEGRVLVRPSRRCK